MDTKKNSKKLELSRETIRTLKVKSDVKTGLWGPVGGISLDCGITLVGCIVIHSKNPVGLC